jgi:hypothetical protein
MSNYLAILEYELRKNNLNWCKECGLKGHNRGFVLRNDKSTIHFNKKIQTRATLHGALHEVGHCINNENGLRSFEREAQAEAYANIIFRRYGLHIPRKTRSLGKNYVRRKKRHGDNITEGKKHESKK